MQCRVASSRPQGPVSRERTLSEGKQAAADPGSIGLHANHTVPQTLHILRNGAGQSFLCRSGSMRVKIRSPSLRVGFQIFRYEAR